MEDVILTPELQRLRLDEVPAEYRQTVISLLRSSMAENTRRSYAGHLRRFFAWAGSRGLAVWPVSPEAAIAWLAELQKRGVSVSYAEAAMAALKKLHILHGMASPTDDPVVTAALKGFARENENSRRPAAAATADIVKELIFAVSWAPKYHEARRARDSALLILGFLGAFRRSELCALKIRDLEWTAGKDGKEVLLIRIGHSKNDPEGQKALTKAFFHTDDPRFDPLILTPVFSNASASSFRPLAAARCRGVIPSVYSSVLVPAFISSSIAAVRPYAAALLSAVMPPLSFAFTSAPAFSNNSTVAV